MVGSGGEASGRAGDDVVLAVTFFGVRGSTPCCSANVSRYGGNTSSVVIEAAGCDPLLLDLGTGVRVYGESLPKGEAYRGAALVSHLHWDHVQGLPFFAPALCAGSRLDIYAPAPGCGMTLDQAVDACIRPPFFPVTRREMAGQVNLQEVTTDRPFSLGAVTVTAKVVPHVGLTVGYRLDCHGVSIAYVPDHQQPQGFRPAWGGGGAVDAAVLELARGVDLLIHDAQYTDEEFAEKATWGHSTVGYAIEVARQAGAATLALFHHDPLHDDAMIDGFVSLARQAASGHGLEVLAAREGLRLTWPGPLR